MKTLLCIIILFSMQTLFAAVRHETNRFKLYQDRAMTDDLFRELGHDFLIDINGTLSKGAQGILKDAKDAADKAGTDAEKIQRVKDFLDRHTMKEHFARVSATIGIPLPSFKFAKVRIRPDLRVHASLGASFSIGDTGSEASVPVEGFGSIPIGVNEPYVQLYAKQDVKTGLNFKGTYGKWFGNMYLYHLNRFDRWELIQSSDVISNDGNKVIDLKKQKNWSNFIDVDLLGGYQFKYTKVWFSLEEVRLHKLSDKNSTHGHLYFSNNLLFRAQVEQKLDLSFFHFNFFAGVHKREGYDFSDAYYGGTELKLGILPISFVSRIDPEYLMLSPRFRLWFLQAEYVLNQPVTSSKDGFKLPTVHSVNLRFAF